MYRATRVSSVFLLFAPLFALFAPAAAALPVPEPPSLDAESYILMDHDSGQILAASSPDQRVEPASITKLMTSYIVFDQIAAGKMALDEPVPISEKAWRMGGSKMFVEVGNQVSVNQLLHGVVTSSGNDATVALAEHIAGTEETFAAYMNQYAEELGLTNSHFVNATGWPAENHYMSAHDIAILGRALIERFPELYDTYYDRKEFTYNNIKQYNRNSLLWTDDSVDGLKTGHTESAGYCLAASAERDGMRLISVVTGTDSATGRKTASQVLLNYGFRFFETHQLFQPGHEITQVRVWKGEAKTLPLHAGGAVHVTAPRGGRDELTTTAQLPERLVAPIAEGERVGTLEIAYGGEPLRVIPLYAAKAVPAGGLVRRLVDEALLLFE